MSFRISNAHLKFFASREEYLAYVQSWKARAQAKDLSANDFLLHALLTGKDLYRAFSPSKRYLANRYPCYNTLGSLFHTLIHVSPKLNMPDHLFRLHMFLQEQLPSFQGSVFSTVATGKATFAEAE